MSTNFDVFELAKLLVSKEETEYASVTSVDFNRCIQNICNTFIKFPKIEIIELIATTLYEKSPCMNKQIAFIVNSMYMNENFAIANFSKESKVSFEKDNVKLIRKLLQPIPKGYTLVLEYDQTKYRYVATGIAQAKQLEFCTYYKVNFTKYMEWNIELVCCAEATKGNTIQNTISLLGYDHGKWVPCVKLEERKKKDINDTLLIIKENFKNISSAKLNGIKTLLTDIYSREVGTSCIIFKSRNDAEQEAELFEKKGRGIKLHAPVVYSSTLIDTILDIDGGVIFDADCNCYAYGCIYDGVYTNSFKGDVSRGARHNSTKLYIDNRCQRSDEPRNRIMPCVGIVFSEDGGLAAYSNNNSII